MPGGLVEDIFHVVGLIAFSQKCSGSLVAVGVVDGIESEGVTVLKSIRIHLRGLLENASFQLDFNPSLHGHRLEVRL